MNKRTIIDERIKLIDKTNFTNSLLKNEIHER